MSSLSLEQVSVAAERAELLSGIDLDVGDGEVIAIVGPSGSGKSSLLRAIAGLQPIVAGRLIIDGLDVTTLAPSVRDAAMVFQEPALLPRRTGRGNVEFPLEMRRETLESIRTRVNAEARAMHIEHLLAKWPDTMSRGEMQLVQIARALVRVPRVLLLDEPFASLDEHRRRALRTEINLLQQGYGVTTLIATNDPEDALALADRVAALEPPVDGRPGRLVQIGPTLEVRREPATLDVAAALGPLWMIAAQVHADGDGTWLVGGRDGSFRLRSWAPALRDRHGERITVGMRNESVVPSSTGAHHARVRRVIPGSEPQLLLGVAGHLVVSSHVDEPSPEPGATINVDLDRPLIFDSSGRRLA